jgi:nucleoside-diphosphate-sugar epimerase
MPSIAVFGGTGYLASLIKNQNNVKKNNYTFFSRKKGTKNHINFLSLKKNLDILKNFDFIIHLAGPNQNQLKRNKRLIEKKNEITSMICDVCLAHNIKLIYISSMQVYNDYGKNNISMNSKINQKNLYSILHYKSEKIIIKKFLKHKKMFTILRMGNVFGFKKNNNLNEINNNLLHSLCFLALKKKKILIRNGSIQRTFVPSQIFMGVIDSIIKKNFFNNSIINISYKSLNLKNISEIIQKRLNLLFNLHTEIVLKKFNNKKKFVIYANRNFKFNPIDKKIYQEIDQILKSIKNNLN